MRKYKYIQTKKIIALAFLKDVVFICHKILKINHLTFHIVQEVK